MDFVVDLFTGSGLATALIFICLTCCVGSFVGKLKIGSVQLGIAGVLFTGIIFAHFGARVDPKYLHFAQEFGLILFVYSVGINVGPRFFSSFRSDGLLLNGLAVAIILLGFGIALCFHYFGGVDASVITGVMCGAVTNTPGLGAAKQVVADYNAANPGALIDESVLGSGYAMAYPLGVVGIIVTMLVVRYVFRIKISKEVEAYNSGFDASARLESVVVKITNPNLFNKSVEYICSFVDTEFSFSRVERNGGLHVPTADFIILEGDIIHGVALLKNIEDLRLKLGEIEIGEKREMEGDLVMKRFLVTNKKIAGKTLMQIGIFRRYHANITRVYRAGMQILPTKDITLEIGDAVRVVGKKDEMKYIQAELGDSVHEWAHPNIIALFLGIALGLFVGAIPFFIPGLPAPAKLGLAGGPLLVAILLGWKGRIGKFSFYMNTAANIMLREMGISLFLGCVGLGAGETFVNTFLNGGYMWVLYGLAITVIPIAIVSVVARLLKINYLKICGFVAGAMTDPPALEFANSFSPVQAQSTAYATVYPLTMFLRILLGQTLILITL